MAEVSLSPSPSCFQGVKRQAAALSNSAQPVKKAKFLLDDTDEDNFSRKSEPLDSDSKSSKEHVFAINQDFACRFEHNKKREERQQRKFTPYDFSINPCLKL